MNRFSSFLQLLVISMMGFVAPSHAASGKHFEHVVIFYFENTYYEVALKQPNFKNFSEQGAFLADFHAETHPSQPNYIALVAGDDFGLETNAPLDLDDRNVADLLEEKGLTWKTYAQGFPGNCYPDRTFERYARKHNPLMSFTQIKYEKPSFFWRNFYKYTGQDNTSPRCNNIVDSSQFGKEPLPNFSLFIPDMDNSGHDTGVSYADKWIGEYLDPLLKNPEFMKDTLIVLTFDEAGDATNHIYTVLLGPMVKPGKYDGRHDHYSLLRMVEDNFSLGNLGKKDVSASIIDVWK